MGFSTWHSYRRTICLCSGFLSNPTFGRGGRVLFLFLILNLSALSGSGQDEEEALFLDLINEYRNISDSCWDDGWVAWPPDAQTLAHSESLTQAARSHNAAMLGLNCFAHVCPGEVGVTERVTAAGYAGWRFLAENIAAGAPTAQSVFDAWKASDGHNKNMRHCRARAIGIARTFDRESPLGWVWTTDFGDVVEVSDLPDEPDPPAEPNPRTDPQPNIECFDLDANDNNRVDDVEVLAVIALWITGGALCR